jgi:hypothetical protein
MYFCNELFVFCFYRNTGATMGFRAKISTDGQSVDAQVKQLRAAGAEKIFKEAASGAKTDRFAPRPRADRRGRRVDRDAA